MTEYNGPVRPEDALKVVWSGKGKVRHFVRKTSIEMDHTGAPLYLETKLDVPDGQQVTVAVLAGDKGE